MDSDDDAGDAVTIEAPHSDRRPGPAAVKMPSEQRFWKSVGDDPRELMGLVAAVSLALLFGSSEVTSGGSFVHQVLGAVVVGAGLLLAVSYALQFRPAVFESEGWSRTRLRRAARAVLKHTYGTFSAMVLLAAFVRFITWLAGRL